MLLLLYMAYRRTFLLIIIFDSAVKTKSSAGPSGIDAELYRRILSSKNFVAEGKTLREEIATLTRKMLKFNYHPSLLEGYTACRLIPLDKNPGDNNFIFIYPLFRLN